MNWLLAIAVFSQLATPPPAQKSQRLLTNEVALGVGLTAASYTYGHGRSGDLFLLPQLEGRALLGGLTGELSASFSGPTRAEGASSATAVGLRLGWTGERFSVTAGPTAQYASRAEPSLQWLPS